MAFEDTVVVAMKELDKDIKELRKKVLELESTVADLTIKCEKLEPPKPVINQGAWTQRWGYK